MKIERVIDEGGNRPGIYHRIADKPNGATVSTANFPMTATKLPEGTMLVEGTNGLYKAIATAKVVETASASSVKYAIEKGSIVNVGTVIVKNGTTNVNVTAIDRTNSDKDVITVDATLGAKNVGDVLTEKVNGVPVGITGEEVPIKAGQNCFVSLWVVAVVNKSIIPEPSVKPVGVYFV